MTGDRTADDKLNRLSDAARKAEAILSAIMELGWLEAIPAAPEAKEAHNKASHLVDLAQQTLSAGIKEHAA